MSEIEVRRARASDVDDVRQLFITSYGHEYPYRDFYDDHWLLKAVYSDNYLFLVATIDDTIVGTASVYFEVGTYTDLMGEFGRLVVDPERRDEGIATRLMEARLRFAEKRLHFGYIEGRTVHPYAQRIAFKHGFRPVGFLPMANLFVRRESMAIMAHHFGAAQQLRRNHPRIIPEVLPLASRALANLECPNDVIVVDHVDGYPTRGHYTVEELTESGIPHLLRIERGRLRRWEVFGNLMLSYGFFALQAKEARYLVAKEGDTIVGAIGYAHDRIGRTVKVLELIAIDDAVGGFLLRELERRTRETMDAAYMEVVVSAYWPRIQRTLEQLGFCPAAYCPSYVFRGMERLDAIRMVKLFVPFDLGPLTLMPEMEELRDVVVRGFMEKRIGVRLDQLARHVSLFDGLTEEQVRKLSRICTLRDVEAGEVIFREGDVDRCFYLVLDGDVDILAQDGTVHVGRVRMGGALGEISLVSGMPHSATAVMARAGQLVCLAHGDFEALTLRYPRIGMTVLNNVARSLGEKLKLTDDTVSALYHATAPVPSAVR